jgi:hypothetical protein
MEIPMVVTATDVEEFVYFKWLNEQGLSFNIYTANVDIYVKMVRHCKLFLIPRARYQQKMITIFFS